MDAVNEECLSKLERIRSEIHELGESIVTAPQLLILCSDPSSARDQWNAIAQIAINEKWSFTFFPNGNVRLANLDSN